MSNPHIIRTAEELEALDPDTVVVDRNGDIDHVSDWCYANGKVHGENIQFLPASVIATSDQLQAARTALQETVNE